MRASRDGAVATVVIDSPARRNALSVEIALGLQDTMAELDADPEVRCVILRGAGGRAFSAGADISEFATWRVNKRRGRIYAGILGAALEAVRTCRHPTIALIEGDCVGGGLGVAVMCDLRVCGRSSRFGVPVKRLGLVESPDELAPLVAKLGANAMLEILLLGEVFGAEDALRPLAQEVHPPAARPPAAHRRGAGRGLRLLRHGGLPDRIQGLPRQGAAEVRREVGPETGPATAHAAPRNRYRRHVHRLRTP